MNMLTGMKGRDTAEADQDDGALLIARLERLPITSPVLWARGIVGMATFFDGYTTLAIAYTLPVLARLWHLTPTLSAEIISSGYFGQLIGAVLFGWMAERIGRLPVLTMTIVIFATMSCACIFAWNVQSLALFRFLQGIGTGGEVPVASAYVNEFVGAQRRGRFFLFYELLFSFGLVFSGFIGFSLVPAYGWRAMFVVGMIPLALVLPLTFTLFESPRWLIGRGRLARAEAVVTRLEESALRRGAVLRRAEPMPVRVPTGRPDASWREIFGAFYGPRTLLLWTLWFSVFLINNGMVTWLPTLYHTTFQIPLSRAVAFGFAMTGGAALAAMVCALTIDRIGRRRWYTGALLFAAVPLITLWLVSAKSALVVFVLASLAYAALQTMTLSLYLYSSELYPTRLRSIGAGLGSAWLRAGSMTGPWVIGLIMARGVIGDVFLVFGLIAAATGLICLRWAPETSGQVLEELSP